MYAKCRREVKVLYRSWKEFERMWGRLCEHDTWQVLRRKQLFCVGIKSPLWYSKPTLGFHVISCSFKARIYTNYFWVRVTIGVICHALYMGSCVTHTRYSSLTYINGSCNKCPTLPSKCQCLVLNPQKPRQRFYSCKHHCATIPSYMFTCSHYDRGHVENWKKRLYEQSWLSKLPSVSSDLPYNVFNELLTRVELL